jgi:hypothetical protein
MKKSGKTTHICASSQKKYVRIRIPSFYLIYFFRAFLGVSRQGSSKTRGENLSAFPKQNARVIFFRVGFVALVKRLSARGTQKRDKQNGRPKTQ